jgi:peptidoglycan/LPS O-acetylase OafA/YrhL
MPRLYGLDALRGVAAMLVLVHYMLSLLAQDGVHWAGSVPAIVDLGKLGVAMFFLISGFVIPFSFQRGLTGFAIGRAFRLLPALWLSILFCIALGAPLEGRAHLFANAFMLTDPMGETTLSSPYWTLSWEMYFYSIVALAYATGSLRSPRTFGLLAIAFAIVSLFEPKAIYLILMLTGTLLRMVMLEDQEPAKSWLRIAIVTLISACLVSAQHGWGQVFVGLAIALPAFVLLWDRPAHAALLWLGNVSFSLYVFHLPILQEIHRAALPPAAFIGLGLLLPLLVAGASYRWVEKPMMALGKAASALVVGRSLKKAAAVTG